VFDASKFGFDVASALSRGKRDTQEDAIVADVSIGDSAGVVVLADGMGGHQAGEVASGIVVTEVFRALKPKIGTLANSPDTVPETLYDAAQSANTCLQQHATHFPATEGMGATLVALVLVDQSLFWISIGDSVLYLIRDGKLRQLNEDHSLAPQIDYMVQRGMISKEAGQNHPDRSVLTSALQGGDIHRIDCPDTPLKLRLGDIVVAASDGLPYLEVAEIRKILTEHDGADSDGFAHLLLKAIKALNHPDQDNVCFSVIRVTEGHGKTLPKIQAAARPDQWRKPAANVPDRAPEGQGAGPGFFGRLFDLGTGLLR